MKFINKITKIVVGLAMTSSVLMSCQEELVQEATAVQTEVTSVTFAAVDAPDQVVNVFANGEWSADVPAEWLAISPMSGNGNTEVTISVTDNVKNGAQDVPRSVTILFRGSSIERQGKLTVNQKGDTYLGVVETTVTETVALEKDKPAKIKGSQVIAVSEDGFVISDGTTAMYVQKKNAEVTAGDKVFLNGTTKVLNGFPAFVLDECEVLESGTVTHPTAVDLTAVVDSYAPTGISYVKIEGTVIGTMLKNIAGTPAKAVCFQKTNASIDMEPMSVHKVTMYAYHIGISGGAHQLVIVSCEDRGADDSIGVEFPFKDDFSWLDPYIQAANAVLPAANQIDDPVAKQSGYSNGAANLYTTLANNGCHVLADLRSRGYVDLNPGQQTIYMQDGYLKFGKTDCQSGLTLPLIKINGTQDIAVQFQWCAHMTEKGKIDTTKLVVAIEGPGTVETKAGTENAKISDPVESKQANTQMFWQDITVKINGATSATFITIRPSDSQMGSVDEPKKGQHRYHIDNINVLLASDLVPANMTVTGVENNLITFEGEPKGPAKFMVLSDREFTVTSSVDWITLSKTSGSADELSEIEVTCAPSELSELRKGEITVKSGTSVYKIQVVQSAAGMELSPFVSLVGGNTGNVGFDAGSFTLGVQANVEYEYSCDAAWVKVEPAPATKAKVEVTDLVVTYEANSEEQPRTAHIRVYNAKSNVETVYTLTQAAYESGIYFQEDFTWVAPWADAYGSADSVGDDNASGKAPNVYTHATHQEYDGSGNGVEGYSSFLAEYAKRGYVDVNPSATSFYTQKYYLKFGATSKHTGIKLPPMELEGATATDVVLTFDWSAHMTSSGNIDKVNIVVELEGDGVCADSRAKISNPISPDQAKGDLKWQPVKMLLKGVTSNTRIIVRPTHLVDHDGITQQRWYIDNVKVAKPKQTVVAAWNLSSAGMPSYKDTFGGTAPGTLDKAAGHGDKYIAANAAGTGKIAYVQIDKTEIDVNNKAARIVGDTGEPYVTGSWVGDYWYLDAEASIPAGSLMGVSYTSRASGTGMKYWLVEYFDGKQWKPAMPVQTLEGTSVQYNLNHNNTANFNVEFVAMTVADMTTFQVRQTCVENAQANGSGALAAPNGGTVRLKGEALSPKIVMF